jgi:bifunctional non-homologous end joining protein LigD
VRCPDGLAGECFYQKHTGTWAPPALRRVKIRERTKIGEYLVVDSLEALISAVQIGILEIHTWGSLASRLEEPDRVVFDLDPDPAVPWARTVEAARLVRARLQAVGLESFVKTTGGKGLHVVAPLVGSASWDVVRDFCQRVAADMVREDPRGFVDEMSKAARAGKIFIDYLRNARGATAVAAYSTRAKPPAPVSVPLTWEELSARTRADAYTVETVPQRLAGLRADPWARYWTLRQSLSGATGGAANRSGGSGASSPATSGAGSTAKSATSKPATKPATKSGSKPASKAAKKPEGREAGRGRRAARR